MRFPAEAIDNLANESEVQQYDIFHRALEIFKERSEVRGDMWAHNGAIKQYSFANDKLRRIEYLLLSISTKRHLTKVEEDALIDDALDAINYIAFMIRQLEGAFPDDYQKDPAGTITFERPGSQAQLPEAS